MRRFFCLLLCLGLLTGCTPRDSGKSATIFAMDTVMDFTAYGDRAQEALDAAAREVNRLEALLSAQREGSDIYAINQQGEADADATVSKETVTLLRQTLELCEKTDGALDITVYPAMEAWGFYDGNYRVPDQDELAALCKRVDYQYVIPQISTVFSQGKMLDLGAVGKGYAGDRIIALWKDMGLTSGLLNLGGNVQCLGGKPDGGDWTIAIRHPEEGRDYLGTVSGKDMAVVTSGAYQRNFQVDGVTYHHILDPRTCAPVESSLTSVTVVGESGFLCDGLSTAIYVMGLDAAVEFWRGWGEFDMILCTREGKIWYTPGLVGRFAAAQGLDAGVLE